MVRNVLGYRLKGRAGVKSHTAGPHFARLWVRTAGRKASPPIGARISHPMIRRLLSREAGHREQP